jgi:hypothetical protein
MSTIHDDHIAVSGRMAGNVGARRRRPRRLPAPEGIADFAPLARPGFFLLRPVSPTGRGATQRRVGGLKRDAGLGAGRHFAATGTARPGIFTFTAPRWLRLVM